MSFKSSKCGLNVVLLQVMAIIKKTVLSSAVQTQLLRGMTTTTKTWPCLRFFFNFDFLLFVILFALMLVALDKSIC